MDITCAKRLFFAFVASVMLLFLNICTTYAQFPYNSEPLVDGRPDMDFSLDVRSKAFPPFISRHRELPIELTLEENIELLNREAEILKKRHIREQMEEERVQRKNGKLSVEKRKWLFVNRKALPVKLEEVKDLIRLSDILNEKSILLQNGRVIDLTTDIIEFRHGRIFDFGFIAYLYGEELVKDMIQEEKKSRRREAKR